MIEQDRACGELVLAVLAAGIESDDDEFVMSQDFECYASLIGVKERALFLLRARYLLGMVSLDILRNPKRLHAQRFKYSDKTARAAADMEGQWQSWPEKAPMRRG